MSPTTKRLRVWYFGGLDERFDAQVEAIVGLKCVDAGTVIASGARDMTFDVDCEEMQPVVAGLRAAGFGCSVDGECYCGGDIVIRKDDLGCDLTQCENYPAACDEAYYTFEQAQAHERAYYERYPEACARFVAKRGFPPGTPCICPASCLRHPTGKKRRAYVTDRLSRDLAERVRTDIAKAHPEAPTPVSRPSSLRRPRQHKRGK